MTLISGSGTPLGMREKAADAGKKAAVKQGKDINERLGLASAGRWMLNYIFPDHWSFMLGEIALYSFIILVLTGVYLAFFFVDSAQQIVYHGSYVPLQGVKMSEAYASTLNLSFNVRAGLVMRQMHHWAALIFLGAIGIHMCRIFFTGAFRKPREINWTIGLTLMILALANGFFGYSLPDDLISGGGLRIAYSVAESIPFVGTWVAEFLFGGPYPGTAILAHMYVLHVFVVPIIILGLLSAHLAIIMRQHHTQFPGKGATETNVVGTPMWPGYMAKSGGYFFMTFAVTALLGGWAQINPIWLFGPYDPVQISTFTQPDWYIGWLDGALRLWPNWEVHLPGHMIPTVFFPAVLLPGIIFNVLYAYPFIEAKLTGDKGYHNLLQRPRDVPGRTAFGAAFLALFFVLLLGGSEDVIAVAFDTSVQAVVWTLRIGAFVIPPIVAAVAYLLCKELSAVPSAGKRPMANVIVRGADGGYSATPVDLHPFEAEHREELEPAPVGHVLMPEPESQLVTAGVSGPGAPERSGRGPAPATSAASAAVQSTAASDIPGVRQVSRQETPGEPAPRSGRSLFPRRRPQGADGAKSSNGDGGAGEAGDSGPAGTGSD
ncbi:MAG: cytochrome bc1 complex cytochrome b subunit [Acidimicrobiales bacterium]